MWIEIIKYYTVRSSIGEYDVKPGAKIFQEYEGVTQLVIQEAVMGGVV